MEAMDVVGELVNQGVIEVRPDGTVWKMRNLRGQPMAAPRRMETVAKNGYLLVKVWLRGRQYLLTAHRLVWEVLHGPIPDLQEVNHRDGNKQNNHPTNLELVSRSENMRHAYRALGRSARLKPVVAKLSAQAKDLRAQGLSYSQIAVRLGVAQTTAFRAARAK